uniref:Immunoglobulin like and fibronectin type III domain containing 1, tandem duplicate 2 n=1 Tax=Oncorhynchus tshawytscha TaxID=74940 RepID=A0A8C8FST0_ONCTS
MWKKSRSPNTSRMYSGIKKRSKVPGVMITQFIEVLPEGKSTPDFLRKPIALTIQEGKLAIFKANVCGDPKPEVTWGRAKGDMSDTETFQKKYDEATGEYTLEVKEADTYKCYAINEYGKAICTAALNVIEVGFKKKKAMEQLEDIGGYFHSFIHSSIHPSMIKAVKEPGEIDERFWEIIMSADRKDYERICAEFGVKDFRVMLKKLSEKKKERQEEQAKYIETINNLKHIDIKGVGIASFEFDLELKDLASRIFLYKDGVMIPYSDEEEMKHSLKTVGKKLIFSVRDLKAEDAGLYQVDVEEVNLFSTDFKIPTVDFIVKIQEVKAKEREDAMFECVLSQPWPRIKWMGKNATLEEGEKYTITVSEDKLIHRLLIKDCSQLDKGIYSAAAGIKTCSAWLIVEADSDPASHGKKKTRKTTQAGGTGLDLGKLAQEQQEKLAKERQEQIDAANKARAEEERLAREALLNNKVKVLEWPKQFPDLNPIENLWFVSGLSNVHALIGQPAELMCKLSNDNCEGTWYRNSKKLTADDGHIMSRDGANHKLVINRCQEEDSGKYRFEADGRKTEAMLNVEDPPRFDPDDLSAFSQPVIVKVGNSTTFKLPFVGREPMKIQWYRKGEELLDDNTTKIEKSFTQSRLLLSKCQRKDTGEIKIKLKNEHGTMEAISRLIVLDKPTAPQGPVEVLESTASCIHIKWRAPKDDGGCPVINYNLERQQVGRNTWKKLGDIPGVPEYKDNDVEHGRKYCYRIRVVTEEGVSEMMETDDLTAGTLAFPSSPAPPKVASAFNNCINLTWSTPTDTGESRILGYNLEKRKKGSNLWSPVNPTDEPIQEKKRAVTDVVAGNEYEFRVYAINVSGLSEPSSPSEFIFAKDPKMRPCFTDNKMKSFMVVRAGNSVRILLNFEASPWPEVTWLKDDVPLLKRVNISNSESSSQLLITSSERSDSGIYTIVVKNLVGQESFSVEVRVTDDPKPPGPVELEENVPGTVTVIWEPSPDEKRDDHLHYSVSKRDSTKGSWSTVADRLFNNKFTACNIMPGREYHFRVYAKNDMGMSAPSESPTWGSERRKGIRTYKTCDLRTAPAFLVPLRQHTAPKGYECYMSCAIKGNPKPRVTWYRNNISLNTNTNYLITNICGVCSLLILRVTPKDWGEYNIQIESALGRAESSTKLTVRGENSTDLL